MRHFEESFQVLNDALREMGAAVAQSVHRGVIALVERDEAAAEAVLRDEAAIDQAEVRIDDLAAGLIAREQPVASDMRLTVAAIRMNSDLERMGDLAASVARRALRLTKLPALPNPTGFQDIGNLAEKAVLGALDAFARRDPRAARTILSSETEIHSIRDSVTRYLLDLMQRDPSAVERAVEHLIIYRCFERIADHAVNVAEDVIFLVEGVDVRHQTIQPD